MTQPAELHNHATAAPSPAIRKRAVMGGAVGNLIEGYDWNCYGLLAIYFAGQIFPVDGTGSDIFAALAVFGIGFVVRPLGAFVFSPMADRLGRRFVLSVTIIAIGVASLVMALTPSYASWGVAAPLIFITARLVQGLSFGGEWQVAAAYLGEQAPRRNRGLVTSAQTITAALGVLLATGVIALTSVLTSTETMYEWGWRVPFLVGAVLSLVGLYIRYRIPETEVFESAKQQDRLTKTPLRDAIRDHPRQLLQVFAIQSVALPFYLWLVFLPTLANLLSGISLELVTIGNLFALVFYAALLAPIAWLSDRKIGRRPLLLATAAGFFVFAYPMFQLLQRPSLWAFLTVAFLGCFLLALTASVQSALLTELFPTKVRATGSGIAYAVSAAVFGGTAPLIATELISSDAAQWIPAYLMGVMLFAGVVFWFIPETRNVNLNADRLLDTASDGTPGDGPGSESGQEPGEVSSVAASVVERDGGDDGGHVRS